MDMSFLKPIFSPFEIISVIEKATLFGGDIWQSERVAGAGLERHVSKIIQIQTEIHSDRLILRTPLNVQINPELPIFVRLNYRNLIFSLSPSDFIVNGDKVRCRYPEGARALEERKGGDRYVLPFNADISLSLKRVEQSMREMTFEMELRIIDVSEKGFGIFISSQNRDCLKIHDHFWLKSIDHKPLRAQILGTVCYVACLKRGDVRIGVSLSKHLAHDVLNSLKRKCLLVLSA
jgi:hypothetical protein